MAVYRDHKDGVTKSQVWKEYGYKESLCFHKTLFCRLKEVLQLGSKKKLVTTCSI